jgi:carbamoyltransferase
MKILGIQKNHNASACLFEDGKLIYYNQEERLSRQKNNGGIPLLCLGEIKKICSEVDYVVLTGYDFGREENLTILNYLKSIEIYFNEWFSYFKCHHLNHAAKAFYASKFDNALVIVSDGRGSHYTLNDGSYAYETTSAYLVDYPSKFELIYKRLYTPNKNMSKNVKLSDFGDFDVDLHRLNIDHKKVKIKNSHDTGHFYEFVSQYLGFKDGECGKMMGLQSYGKHNNNIPELVVDFDFCENIFDKELYKIVRTDLFPTLRISDENRENLIDFSFHTQKAFEEVSLHRIKQLIAETGCKNLVLTGGTALNVVANNYFRKNIPTNINLYIEPLCGDEGNSIGAAQQLLYDLTKTNEKYAIPSIYMGPKPKYTFNLKEGEQCFDDVKNEYVANLLSGGNIVSVLQGSSEGGPRALGNRSILFDPRVKNGKDIVNIVKKREWFRPFACSILSEHSRNWFDMHCLDESPHMMYALDALPGVKEKIPAVVHVDNTCRVQTVTREQNKHFYDLIQEFYKITGVPLLLNTSFNLAGDPLVETIEDALNTLRKSELEYLYLPEIGKLIYIKNENKQLK